MLRNDNKKNKVTHQKQNKYLLKQSKNYLTNKNFEFNLEPAATLNLANYPGFTFLLCLAVLSKVINEVQSAKTAMPNNEDQQQCPLNPFNISDTPTKVTSLASQGLFRTQSFNYPSAETIKILKQSYDVTGDISKAEFIFIGENHLNKAHKQLQLKFMSDLTKAGDYLFLEYTPALETVKPCKTSDGTTFSNNLNCMGWDYTKNLQKKYNGIFGKYFYQQIIKDADKILKTLATYNKEIFKLTNNLLLSKNEMDQLLLHIQRKDVSSPALRNFCEKTLRLGVKLHSDLGAMNTNGITFETSHPLSYAVQELFNRNNLINYVNEVMEELKYLASLPGMTRRNNRLAETLKKYKCPPPEVSNKPCPRKVILSGYHHLPDHKHHPMYKDSLKELKETVDKFDTAVLRPKK